MAVVKDFYEFLVEAELQHYYNGFKDDLKVTGVSQLKYVDEDDLVALGMTRPEMRRLKKHYHKECPKGAFGKIKKRMSLRSSQAQKPVVTVEARPAKTSKHIIPLDAITLCKTLGTGEFGVVQQGVWTNEDGERVQVAIKCLQRDKIEEIAESKESAGGTKYQDFLREVTTMHTLDHENIVRMYGVVFDKDCMMLVSELAPLRSLLECLKEPNLRTTLTVTVLCDFAIQIASGMSYLESKRLIHRDLAARNCLVFAKDRVKISDFGLSRALGMGKDYYQTNFNANLRLPVAWCAPECINYLRFTSASDVWAFATTLWEIFSYGFQPWAAMTGQQILEAIDEPNCQRLDCPDYCPVEYYQLMLKCWEHQEQLRPTFSDLLSQLRQCKPEEVRAIKDSPNHTSKDFLEYKIQDIITVLDKRPPGNPEMYRGSLVNGKTGLFNPSDVVPHTEFKHLQSPQYRRTKVSKKESTRKSQSLNRNRISAAMISGPQNDLRHTGHVGYDGFMFGDVSFIGDNYDKLPVKVAPKGQLNGSSGSLLSSDSGSPSPVRPQHIPGLPKSASNHDNRQNGGGFLDSLTDTDSCVSVSTLGPDDIKYEDVDDDFGNFKMPDMSPGFGLDFGSSLMDEIFKSLDDKPEAKPKKESESESEDEGTPRSSPTRDIVNKESRLKKFKHRLEIRRDNSVPEHSTYSTPDINVKPMSASEERNMDHVIELAKEMAKINSCDTMLSTSPKLSDAECESPKNKINFRIPFTKAKSPKILPERPSFSEEMGRIEQKEVEMNEGMEVYEALVTNRKPRAQRRRELNRLSADSSDNDSRSTSSGEGRLNRTSSSERTFAVVDRNVKRQSSEDDKSASNSGTMNGGSSLPRPREAPPPPPPKPRVSPFSSEGKSFISAPLESNVSRNKIGTVELKSIERLTVDKVHIPEQRVSFAANTEVAESFGLRRVGLPDKPKVVQDEDCNPLRMLRSGPAVFRPSSRPASSRKFSTEELGQSYPGAPYRRKSVDNARVPNIPGREMPDRENPFRNMTLDNPPLPPRDTSRPGTLNIKPRQRKHPLLIGDSGKDKPERNENGHKKDSYTPLADCSAEQLGFFNDLDPFWNEEVKFDEDSQLGGVRYKNEGSGVSYEDLNVFGQDRESTNGQCDEVRLMQRILRECSDDECLAALEQCCYNVHNSIKFVKLKQLLSLGLGDVEVCKDALMNSNWSVESAADRLIENPLHSPECVDV